MISSSPPSTSNERSCIPPPPPSKAREALTTQEILVLREQIAQLCSTSTECAEVAHQLYKQGKTDGEVWEMIQRMHVGSSSRISRPSLRLEAMGTAEDLLEGRESDTLQAPTGVVERRIDPNAATARPPRRK